MSQSKLPGIDPDAAFVLALWLKRAIQGDEWALDKLNELQKTLRVYCPQCGDSVVCRGGYGEVCRCAEYDIIRLQDQLATALGAIADIAKTIGVSEDRTPQQVLEDVKLLMARLERRGAK